MTTEGKAAYVTITFLEIFGVSGNEVWKVFRHLSFFINFKAIHEKVCKPSHPAPRRKHQGGSRGWLRFHYDLSGFNSDG